MQTSRQILSSSLLLSDPIRGGGGGSSDRRSHRKRLLSSEYDTHGRAGGRTEGKREEKVFFFFDSTQKVSPKLVMLNFSKSQAMRMRILSLLAGEKRRLLPLTPCMAERATTVKGRRAFLLVLFLLLLLEQTQLFFSPPLSLFSRCVTHPSQPCLLPPLPPLFKKVRFQSLP